MEGIDQPRNAMELGRRGGGDGLSRQAEVTGWSYPTIPPSSVSSWCSTTTSIGA